MRNFLPAILMHFHAATNSLYSKSQISSAVGIAAPLMRGWFGNPERDLNDNIA
jgi:hypothetical protein